MVNKVIVAGNVAVLVSPGYGSGWSTQGIFEDEAEALLFHPKLVRAVIDEVEDPYDILCDLFGDDTADEISTHGWENVVIKWVPRGTSFVIDEYDGDEMLILNPEPPFVA